MYAADHGNGSGVYRQPLELGETPAAQNYDHPTTFQVVRRISDPDSDTNPLLGVFLHSDGLYAVLMYRATRALNQPAQ